MTHPTPCIVHRCPNLTAETYCDEHAVERQRRYERARGSREERGYDWQWNKVRKGYLRKVGWRCERCGDRPIDTSKVHVHHRDHDATGPRRFDHDNLEALCISCHSSLHWSEEPPQAGAREPRVWGL